MRMNNEDENFELLDNIEKPFDITNHMHLEEIINKLNICLFRYLELNLYMYNYIMLIPTPNTF